MKKLLFFITIAFLAFSCSKEDVAKKFDTTKTINVRAFKTLKSYSTSEIVKTVDCYSWQYDRTPTERYTPRGFLFDQDKDTINNIIKLRHELLFMDDKIYDMFVNGYNFVFVRRIWNEKHNDVIRVDTIAYIPNSMLKKARAIIEDNHAKGNYEACYAAMDTCYKFVPTTNLEYRELKKKGLN